MPAHPAVLPPHSCLKALQALHPLTLFSVFVQTLAYLLPVLTKAIQNAEKEFLGLQQQGKAHEAGTLQALVVVPSRELAIQIVRVAQGLLPHEARATIQQCIGGANPNRQVSCNLPLCKVLIGSAVTEVLSVWLHCPRHKVSEACNG